MPKKKVENETEMPIDETKSPDDETKTKDLNESALQKVEEKFEEFVGEVKESETEVGDSNELNFDQLRDLLGRSDVDISNQQILDEASEKLRELNKLNGETGVLSLVLVDCGWNGQGSAIEVARQIILSQNAELQVLDTTLIANLIKEPDSKIHPIEAAVRFINNYQKKMDEVVLNAPQGRLLAEGTKLQIGGETVVLATIAIANYPDEQFEPKFVGMCAHSDNLEVNKPHLRFRYNGLGIRLGLEEQVDDPADLPRFIAQLTEEEANSFGISSELWEQYQVKN